MLVPLPRDHTAQSVGDALIDALAPLPAALSRSLTSDQGNEMFQHARIEEASGIRIYFADARSPCQRGTNENTNGLLRQYFPKSSDRSIRRALTGRSGRLTRSSTSPTNSTIATANASTT